MFFGVQNEEEEFQIPVTIKASYLIYQSTKKLVHFNFRSTFIFWFNFISKRGNY